MTSDEDPKISLQEEQADATELNTDNQFTSKKDLDREKKDQDIENMNLVTVSENVDREKKNIGSQKDDLYIAKENNDSGKIFLDKSEEDLEQDTTKDVPVPTKDDHYMDKEDVDSNKNCTHKLHMVDLPTKDKMIKSQENHKIKKSDFSSIDTANFNENFVQPEIEESQRSNSCDKSEEEKDSLQDCSDITESTEGIIDLDMLTEAQQNILSGVDKVESVLEQVNDKTSSKDDPPRALTDEEKDSDTLKPEDERQLSKSDITHKPHVDPSETESKLAQASSDGDKSSVQSLINWPSDPNRNNQFIKQMTEPLSESCIPIMCYSKQSPDTSDDSPSALEMEEIPAALIYMPNEEMLVRPPITLDPPLALSIPPEKAAICMPPPELSVEAGLNTSPEVTESVLSEDEPEMDSLFPKPESLAVVGEHKNDITSPVSSIGTTYSVG